MGYFYKSKKTIIKLIPDYLEYCEVEKGLVINSRRISPKEIAQANVENFLSLMLEQNLKSVSFIKGLTEDELDRFIKNLSSLKL